MEWISVEDRMPPKETYVLVYCNSGENSCIAFAMNFGRYFVMTDDVGYKNTEWKTPIDSEITHWMPMPEPPKENEDELD